MIMNEGLKKNDKIFVAGSSGMVGSAINSALVKKGYGNSAYGGKIITATRSQLNLGNLSEVKNFF